MGPRAVWVGVWMAVGCAGGGDDSAPGDSTVVTDTSTAEGPSFADVSWDCADGQVCQWEIRTAGAHAGSVDLYLEETGAAEPWSEHHWLFTDVSGGAGAQRFDLALDLVAEQAAYADNVTTWLDMDAVGDLVSWLVFVKDDAAGVTDCATGGEDPDHWAGTCP